jgi:hypothetical protein
VPVGEYGLQFENLELLLSSRRLNSIVYLSGDPFKVVVARKSGFQSLPMVRWDINDQSDYQLCLVENYLLRIGFMNDQDFRNKIKDEFSYLTDPELECLPPKKRSNSSSNFTFGINSLEKMEGFF